MLCLLKVEDGLVNQTNTAGENKQVNNEKCAKCKTKQEGSSYVVKFKFCDKM
jgi:hypothetical protein